MDATKLPSLGEPMDIDSNRKKKKQGQQLKGLPRMTFARPSNANVLSKGLKVVGMGNKVVSPKCSKSDVSNTMDERQGTPLIMLPKVADHEGDGE